LAAQESHEDAPAATVQLPLGHFVQAVELASAKEPTGHSAQFGALTVVEYEPAAHGVHGDVVFVVDPAGHGGTVLKEHTSESPAPPVKKLTSHTHVDGSHAPVPAAEVELPGHAAHRLDDEL
jgi:hypothetical protein